MTNLNDHLQKEAHKFRMTDGEKAAMRARLSAVMTPAPMAPVRRTPSPYLRFFAPRSVAVFSLALLVLLSTGTAYAAEGSLPGGVFWPVKTSVLEPLTIALASTPAEKAEVNAQIATKRVAEAQTLAAHGALTSEAAKAISLNYTAHATAALALAKDVDEATSTTDEHVPAADIAKNTEPNSNSNATLGMQVGTTSESEDSSGAAKTAMTFSARTTIAPAQAPAPTPAAATTTLKKASVTAQSASSTTTAQFRKHGLSGKLNATLSAQAKLLQQIGVHVNSDPTNANEGEGSAEDAN
jgi:hypothetical protein